MKNDDSIEDVNNRLMLNTVGVSPDIDMPNMSRIKEYNGIYYDTAIGSIYYDVIDIYGHMFGEGIVSRILLELRDPDSEDESEIIAYIDKYRNRFITEVSSLNKKELSTHSREVIVEFINGHSILIDFYGFGKINTI